MKPTISIYNAKTGEIINREMTEDETDAYNLQQSNLAAEKASELEVAEAKATAKAAAEAKLAALGLTADDLKALGL